MSIICAASLLYLGNRAMSFLGAAWQADCLTKAAKYTDNWLKYAHDCIFHSENISSTSPQKPLWRYPN